MDVFFYDPDFSLFDKLFRQIPENALIFLLFLAVSFFCQKHGIKQDPTQHNIGLKQPEGLEV